MTAKWITFAPLAMLALLLGCQAGHNETPQGKAAAGRPPIRASLVDEGFGHMGAVAPRAGTLYLYDVTSDQTLFEARAAAGDRLVVDVKTNSITWNGQDVSEHPFLEMYHQYKIFFLTDE